MKAVIAGMVAAMAMTIAYQARAVDAKAAQALLRSNGCMGCHSVNKKRAGPSYRDMATRYHGDPTAEAKLISKVKHGGSGAWGRTPMPPYPGLDDKDLKTMVDWILSLKKK